MSLWETVNGVVYFDKQTHVCACVRMVVKNEKHWKMMKKVPFPSCAREAHVRRMKKNDDFRMFFIVFNHVNACATMRLLVKIHNRYN